MSEVITVDISPAGSVKIEASGFRGKACEEATQPIEIALGQHNVERKPKPEANMPPIATGIHTRRTF
jgi:hypothetical protein